MATKAPKEAKEKATKNRATGKTLGLGIQATWTHLFEANEKRGATKLTDAEISKFMHKEFPGRNSAVFDRVQHVRGHYNRGFSGTAPKVQSSRYSPEGAKEKVKAGRPQGMVIKKKAA